MTNQRMKDHGEAIILIADGKWDKTQWENQKGEWSDHLFACDAIHRIGTTTALRPKPEPKVRDWSKPQDIPGPGPCYVRFNADPDDRWSMITSASPNGITAGGGRISWETMKSCVHSTDLKTWHKCEVTEEAP